MTYFPICLDIRDRPCLVIGGGEVATRKATSLLDCGARVTVVGLRISERLCDLARKGRIAVKKRGYRAGDLDGQFLVIGATDDESLNRRVHADAEARRVLCNIADRPEICHFILPAVVRRGDLTLTVSTGGKSPAFAKYLRKRLEQEFGTEYEPFLRLMGAVRKELLRRAHAPEQHKPLLERLIGEGLLDMVRDHRTADIDTLFADVLGDGFTFDALMRSAE